MAIDPERIFTTAQLFHESDFVLSTHATQRKDYPFFISSAVNGALALELYLKCLILIDTGKAIQNTHNYWILFQKLKRETQTEIKDWYARLPPSLIEIASQHDPGLKEQNKEFTLEAELKRSQDAFVMWRYVYELGSHSGETTTSASGRVRDSVIQVIRARQPNWPLRPSCVPRTSPAL
jgi:hypothetical protein